MMPLDRSAMNVAEINALVDRLRTRSGRFVPYVHQMHGGVRAPVLSVLRDPGRATHKTDVLSTDNPDPTSSRQRELMFATGLSASDICPWNAYPFAHDEAIDGKLTPDVVARGAVTLTELLPLMRNLKVLLLQGNEARWAWAMVQAFESRYAEPEFEVVRTCHPLGTRGRTAAATADNRVRQLAAWQRTSDIVRRTYAPRGEQ